MKKWLAKIRTFMDKVKTDAGVPAIDAQIEMHIDAVKKFGGQIISQEINGIFVKSQIQYLKKNVENVLNDTADKMSLEASGKEFSRKVETAFEKNPDFLFAFFDSAKHISKEELRKYWTSVLKGELESPGKMSIAIVDVMRKIDKDTAALFEKILPYRSNSWFFYDMDRQYPISLNEVDKLVEYGLLLPDRFGQAKIIKIGDDGRTQFNCGPVAILAERIAGDGDLAFYTQNFSSVACLLAQELVPISVPDPAYLAELAKFAAAGPVDVDQGIEKAKCRLYLPLNTGKSILIDPAKPNGGVLFYKKMIRG